MYFPLRSQPKLTEYSGVSNEGTIFTPSNINSPSDMDSFLKNNWPKLQSGQLNQLHTYFPQVKSTFPGKGSYWATAALAYGDFRYNCPGVWLNKMVDTHGGGSTNWHYWWDVVSDANQKSGLGSTHTAEVEPIWGAAKSAPDTSLTPIISSYWASFIRSKDPNKFRAPGAPEWKTFGSEANRIHFPNDPKQVGMTTVDKGQLDRCQYYSVIGNMIGQ
jgi:carboxylesterase type B